MKVYLIGYMGSGKSTLGRLLADTLDLPFLDMDDEFELKYKIGIHDFFAKYGEDNFRKLEHNLLIDISLMEDAVVSSGGGTPCFFNNMEIMNNTGTTVYLKSNSETLLKRLETSPRRRPLVQMMNGGLTVEKLSEHLASREKFYSLANIIIPSSNPEIEEIKKMILLHLPNVTG